MKPLPRAWKWMTLSVLLITMTRASVLQANAEFDSARLKAILTAFEKREDAGEGDQSTKAHIAWLKTPQGKADVAYLVEHYGKIREFDRVALALELARTVQPEIVPFLDKALEHRWEGNEVMSGIYDRCRYETGDQEFRKLIAPPVARWLAAAPEKIVSSAIDKHGIENAIELLPRLDSALAEKVLMTDRYLSPDSPYVAMVLNAFNNVHQKVPMERIESILTAMHPYSKDLNSEFLCRLAYCKAATALAAYEPERALKLAEEVMNATPGEGSWWSEVVLAAAGLTGIYERLCDFTNSPADFESLPKPGRLFFAVKAFDLDCNNGGIGQALHNPIGDMYPLVKEGYETIGDKRALSWLAAMCKPFGENGPELEQRARIRQMESMKPDYWEQEDALYEAWVKEWTTTKGSDSQPDTEWLLAKYAARNAAVFRSIFSLPVPSKQ